MFSFWFMRRVRSRMRLYEASIIITGTIKPVTMRPIRKISLWFFFGYWHWPRHRDVTCIWGSVHELSLEQHKKPFLHVFKIPHASLVPLKLFRIWRHFAAISRHCNITLGANGHCWRLKRIRWHGRLSQCRHRHFTLVLFVGGDIGWVEDIAWRLADNIESV